LAIAKLMKEATRSDPQMWGAVIVGFGTRLIQYAGGREADWLLIAFATQTESHALHHDAL
jgi:hypothetical protein